MEQTGRWVGSPTLKPTWPLAVEASGLQANPRRWSAKPLFGRLVRVFWSGRQARLYNLSPASAGLFLAPPLRRPRVYALSRQWRLPPGGNREANSNENRLHKVAMSVFAGVALGAAAIQGLHAQAKPKAYVV